MERAETTNEGQSAGVMAGAQTLRASKPRSSFRRRVLVLLLVAAALLTFVPAPPLPQFVEGFSTTATARPRASSSLFVSKNKPSRPIDTVDLAEAIPVVSETSPSSTKEDSVLVHEDSADEIELAATRKYTGNMMMVMEDSSSDSSNDDREKFVVLGLLWSIAAISALDRVAMSVALLPMSTELDLSNTLKGSISSLFSVGYGIGILPAGFILSTLSPRQVMAFGITVWSLATIATPASAELITAEIVLPLFLVRAFVGAGESFVIPTIQRLLAVWTKADQKSLGEYMVLVASCFLPSQPHQFDRPYSSFVPFSPL